MKSDIEIKYNDYSKQGIVNILRTKYNNDLEKAYLSELKCIPDTCINCGKPAKFISIFKGYYKTCKSIKCGHIERFKKIRNENDIKKCIICSKDLINIFIKDKTKRKYCSINCETHKFKRLQNIEIIENFNPTDLSYLSKLIYEMKRDYSIMEIKKILLKNLLFKNHDYSIIKNNKSFFSNLLKHIPVTQYFLTADDKYLILKNDVFIIHNLKTIYGENIHKYYLTFFPDFHRKCMVCDELFLYQNPYINLNNKKSEYTCSAICYWKNMSFYANTPNKVKANKKSSINMKNKISSGLWTPCIINTYTHKDIIIINKNTNDTYKFRSSWEALFFIIYETEIIYEKIRIPYVINNEMHNYIIDFVDENNKILFEIKPKSEVNKLKNIIKIQEATKWAYKNNYTYKIISEDYFKLYDFEMINNIIKNKNFFITNDILNKIQKLLNGSSKK